MDVVLEELSQLFVDDNEAVNRLYLILLRPEREVIEVALAQSLPEKLVPLLVVRDRG